jgi:hypothetical protein
MGGTFPLRVGAPIGPSGRQVIEDDRAVPGEIVEWRGGSRDLMRLVDGREIVAVLPGRQARQAFIIRGGERAEIAFSAPPKMPRV